MATTASTTPAATAISHVASTATTGTARAKQTNQPALRTA